MSSVEKTNNVNSKKPDNVTIYKDNPPGGASSDTIFNIQKPNTDGLSPEEAKAAMKKYQDSVNYQYYQQRFSIFQSYVKSTGRSPFAGNYRQEPDVAYNYVNENAGGDSPVAQDYSLTLDATYKDETKKSQGKNWHSQENNHYLVQTRVSGQHAAQGNNVPVANTFIAFLSNDNSNTTATIKNTTVEQLADNYFKTADTIQTSEAPGIERKDMPSETLLSFRDESGSGQKKFLKSLDSTVINNDGILSDDEVSITQKAYVFDAETLTAANKLKQVKGDAVQRTSSASTVDMDDDDPYKAFFQKVASSDGKAGVTKEELVKGIRAIAEERPDGSLYFSREKLNKYLGIQNK